MNLRIAKVGILYIYLEWDVVPGSAGYWFFKDGKRVSWTANPLQTTTRFLKPLTGSVEYAVMAILPGLVGFVTYPQPQPRTADSLMPLRGA